MKAFVHAFNGKPWNEECEAAYRGFEKLGIECVLFSTNEELTAKTPEDIVVGGMLIVGSVLEELGIKPKDIDYPESLLPFCGRTIKKQALRDLPKEKMPFFAKPVREKIAKGKVICSLDDLLEYNNLELSEVFYCCESMAFVSEWRYFVCDRELIGMQCYNGDRTQECDRQTVLSAIRHYADIPRGCSLDFGRTVDGKTILIEVNDDFALGCYGLDDVLYTKLLMARWQELLETAQRRKGD